MRRRHGRARSRRGGGPQRGASSVQGAGCSSPAPEAGVLAAQHIGIEPKAPFAAFYDRDMRDLDVEMGCAFERAPIVIPVR